jgi:hypothetical protein
MFSMEYHLRLQTSPDVAQITSAYNLKIRDAGLKIHNHDKGLDRFVCKFDPEEEMRAAMSVHKGQYGDHVWAVFVRQKKRRRCLLDTTYGLSDEEAFWKAMSAWATFHPRQAKPWTDPGLLFYLGCFDQHPDFVN